MIPAGTPLGDTTVALTGGPVAGVVDADGRLLHLGKLEGWWDAPASSGTVTQKVNEHGAFLGPAYYGPRIVNWTTNIDGLSPADSLRQARKLAAALPVSTLTTLTVTDADGPLTAAVRQEGDPIIIRSGNRVIVSLSMLAPDSRRYGPAQVVSTGLPQMSGGITLPIVLPLVLTGAASAGVLTLINSGDLDSQPVFTVSGPCPPFTITDDQGRQLTFNESLGTGRTLVIDTAARTALLDGIANRVVTGSWPVLRPGVNTIRFNASSYDAGAQLSVSYRSAWR
jgi:hypothetical protein